MRPRARLLALILAAALLADPAVGIADTWPAWANGSSESQLATERSAYAIDLMRETVVRFDGSDRWTETVRRVVRIRTREGRLHAFPAMAYSTDGGKLKSLRAWIKRPSGTVTEMKEGDAVDAVHGDALYDETRVRQLPLPDDADAGSTVAWEGVVEARMPFPQLSPSLQGTCPVVRSRVRVEAPAGWTARAAIWNHAPVEPKREGTATTWEFGDLPEIADEPSGIPPDVRAPQIGISLIPDGANRSASPMLQWEDVSRWLASLADPQATVTPALESKARSLTAGLTPEQRVRAIARYVQGVNYISVQMGIGRGGGYRPHPAADVLSKNYGDCKDKANLMRALLRAVGVEAYPVVISAIDPEYVRQEWPSPLQFNHCIIGVRSGSDAGGCMAEVPGIGSIAVFDPTDPSTPWGFLPAREQGAYALLVSDRGGALFQMPRFGPRDNHEERAVQAEIDAQGTLTCLLRERASGTPASRARWRRQGLATEDFRKAFQERIGAGGVTVTSLQTSEDSSGVFGLEASFQSPRYARPVAGFLSFPAVFAEPLRMGTDWPETRRGPLRLEPYTLHETARIRFPAGFTVEEIPPPFALESAFGTYRLQFAIEDGALAFERSLQIEPRTLPIDDYPAARRFFEQIRGAEATQMLLTRR